MMNPLHKQRPIWIYGATVSLLLVALTGCYCRETPEPAATPEAIDAGAQPDSQTTGEIVAAMRVVDRSGAPLSGMMPIVTLQPNAFDEPIATGPLTDMQGNSRVRFPSDQKVTLRAWDPDLRYFPNNFYEALPNTGRFADTLVVGMVESSSIEAVLVLPDGRFAAEMNSGIMMFHPVHGPWWPSQADSAKDGSVLFTPVPPGQYVMRIKVASGAEIEIPETFLPPGKSTHLGLVYLQ